MEKVDIDDVPIQNSPLGVHSERRPVSSVLGTDAFAMNFFRLQPGESFSGGLHTHHDQEEVFYVEEGTATFEVLASQRDAERSPGERNDPGDGREREEVEVGAGELIRFAPGEFQQGDNTGEDELVGWALGAPKAQHDWDALESIVPCRDCGEETAHAMALTDEGRFEMTCTVCDSSFVM